MQTKQPEPDPTVALEGWCGVWLEAAWHSDETPRSLSEKRGHVDSRASPMQDVAFSLGFAIVQTIVSIEAPAMLRNRMNACSLLKFRSENMLG